MAILIQPCGTRSVVEIVTDCPVHLSRVCGLSRIGKFKCHHTWTVEGNHVSLYGTTQGKKENKFELPPPVDELLFFDNCLLVNRREGKVTPLGYEEWTQIYNALFGGFEDLDDERASEESIDGEFTKEGYAKDGFVVSDDE